MVRCSTTNADTKKITKLIRIHHQVIFEIALRFRENSAENQASIVEKVGKILQLMLEVYDITTGIMGQATWALLKLQPA
jgi:hypothetical protein